MRAHGSNVVLGALALLRVRFAPPREQPPMRVQRLHAVRLVQCRHDGSLAAELRELIICEVVELLE